MKRVWLWVVPVVLVLFVIAGCGGPPTADDVKLEDLENHRGSGDYTETDWDDGEVEADFDEALEMILVSLGDIQVEERSLSVDTVRSMLLDQLGKSVSSKAAYMEDLSNEDTFGFKFVIENEVIDGTNNPYVASGSLEIPSFVTEFKLGGEGTEYDGRLWLDLLMDGDLEAAGYNYGDYTVVVDHGIIRIGSTGDAEIAWNESQYSLKYSFYLDFKIGLSVHTEDPLRGNTRGGKMLFNLHYDESFSDSLSSTEYDGLSDGDYSAAPVSNLSARLEVYGNNSSTPLFSDTYDETDIINLSENLMDIF